MSGHRKYIKRIGNLESYLERGQWDVEEKEMG